MEDAFHGCGRNQDNPRKSHHRVHRGNQGVCAARERFTAPLRGAGTGRPITRVRERGESALYCPVRQMKKRSDIQQPKKSGNHVPGGHPLDLAEGRRVRSTTVLCVRRGNSVVMAADGQVTLGATVMKQSARKIRRLYNDKILAGFAGSTADAFSLFTRFEAKLEQYSGNLGRAAVELAKDWRTDKLLRQLEALLIVADTKGMFLLSGDGDVIEPDATKDATIATIGSGGNYALAAATALVENTELSAREIVERSMRIAADICIYSNQNVVVEELKADA